jgi:hypothetical protein
MLPDFRFIIGAALAATLLAVSGLGLFTATQLAHQAKMGPLETSRSLAFADHPEFNQFYDAETARRFEDVARKAASSGTEVSPSSRPAPEATVPQEMTFPPPPVAPQQSAGAVSPTVGEPEQTVAGTGPAGDDLSPAVTDFPAVRKARNSTTILTEAAVAEPDMQQATAVAGAPSGDDLSPAVTAFPAVPRLQETAAAGTAAIPVPETTQPPALDTAPPTEVSAQTNMPPIELAAPFAPIPPEQPGIGSAQAAIPDARIPTPVPNAGTQVAIPDASPPLELAAPSTAVTPPAPAGPEGTGPAQNAAATQPGSPEPSETGSIAAYPGLMPLPSATPFPPAAPDRPATQHATMQPAPPALPGTEVDAHPAAPATAPAEPPNAAVTVHPLRNAAPPVGRTVAPPPPARAATASRGRVRAESDEQEYQQQQQQRARAQPRQYQQQQQQQQQQHYAQPLTGFEWAGYYAKPQPVESYAAPQQTYAAPQRARSQYEQQYRAQSYAGQQYQAQPRPRDPYVNQWRPW